MTLDYQKIKAGIESLLFVSGEAGLTTKELAQVIELEEELVDDLMYDLMADFDRHARGIQIVKMGNAFFLTTRPEFAPLLEKLAESPNHSTLSQAAMETLAIIAYKQPVTRLDIEEIRGVKCERAIQTLLNKGLIKEIGRAELPGKPYLYGVTSLFMEHFGVTSLEDLPPLSDVIQEDEGEEPLFHQFSIFEQPEKE
jgi:segregation and condensation protein B